MSGPPRTIREKITLKRRKPVESEPALLQMSWPLSQWVWLTIGAALICGAVALVWWVT